jgi:hypothetical protein
MKMDVAVDEVLEMAGATLADLAAAQEAASVHTLFVEVNEAGEGLGAVLACQSSGAAPPRMGVLPGHRLLAVWTGGGTGQRSLCIEDEEFRGSCTYCVDRHDCDEWLLRQHEIREAIQQRLDELQQGGSE